MVVPANDLPYVIEQPQGSMSDSAGLAERQRADPTTTATVQSDGVDLLRPTHLAKAAHITERIR